MLMILGYGYSKSATVEGIVDGYRTSGIPLDGMHLDVDFQVRSRRPILIRANNLRIDTALSPRVSQISATSATS